MDGWPIILYKQIHYMRERERVRGEWIDRNIETEGEWMDGWMSHYII